jgi:hypothetical protein
LQLIAFPGFFEVPNGTIFVLIHLKLPIMKKFLTILFIAGGLFFAHSVNAQTANPKAGADTSANKKANAGQGDSKPGNGSDIAVDENGTPKPKHKKKNSEKQGNPNKEAKGSSSDDVGSPAEIAIDESGTSRPKPKPAKAATAPDPPNSDSTIVAPANAVGRPQE